MDLLTKEASFTTSCPATHASPSSGSNRVDSILIRVLFPAPFSPSKPNTSPLRTVKLTPSRAVLGTGTV